MYPAQTNPGQITKLVKNASELFNWTGVQFPAKLEDIDRFEKINSGISNVAKQRSTVTEITKTRSWDEAKKL